MKEAVETLAYQIAGENEFRYEEAEKALYDLAKEAAACAYQLVKETKDMVELRDSFAMSALQAILPRQTYNSFGETNYNHTEISIKYNVKLAYKFADAMLEARKK